ncbi:hypothetical protein [Bradyrhizobium jicamae]|uniref:hypothetical protein n=1 Tax=Bradyrhizobium jicamae TaxID=280332 RepID=UPI001BA569F7|nr:hypothetical protein [Bradyrhizobium jicamae]MBR0933418.1 hypothetical protein [Bradyrhizobium jicamae]
MVRPAIAFQRISRDLAIVPGAQKGDQQGRPDNNGGGECEEHEPTNSGIVFHRNLLAWPISTPLFL